MRDERTSHKIHVWPGKIQNKKQQQQQQQNKMKQEQEGRQCFASLFFTLSTEILLIWHLFLSSFYFYFNSKQRELNVALQKLVLVGIQVDVNGASFFFFF